MHESDNEQPNTEQVFFEDPALDRALGVVLSLATEVYVLRDRLRAMEARLVESGALAPNALDAEPSAEELAASAVDRDAFVAHLMQNLTGLEQSKGVR